MAWECVDSSSQYRSSQEGGSSPCFFIAHIKISQWQWHCVYLWMLICAFNYSIIAVWTLMKWRIVVKDACCTRVIVCPGKWFNLLSQRSNQCDDWFLWLIWWCKCNRANSQTWQITENCASNWCQAWLHSCTQRYTTVSPLRRWGCLSQSLLETRSFCRPML